MKTTTTRTGVAGAVRDYGAYRRTMRELAWLSDRDLSDLGHRNTAAADQR